jgi:hypothetical protein
MLLGTALGAKSVKAWLAGHAHEGAMMVKDSSEVAALSQRRPR